MKIKGLYPQSFGKFKDASIEFGDGLNIIYGENETGKSTLFAFLRGMLFGIETPRGRKVKGAPYDKHKPWDTPGAYQGAMDLEWNGVTYRVERNFLMNEKSLRVTQLDTGREVPLTGELMEHFAPQVSEAGFVNTVLAPQGGAGPDDALSSELANHIANLSMAKNREVDVAGANERLRQLERSLDAKKLPQREAELAQKLQKDELEQQQLDVVERSLRESQERLVQIEADLAELARDTSGEVEVEFQGKVREYEDYCNDVFAANERTNKLDTIRQRRECVLFDTESEEELAEIAERRERVEEREAELRKQWEERKARADWEVQSALRRASGGRTLLLVASLLLVAAVVGAILLWPVGVALAAASVGCFVVYLIRRSHLKKDAAARKEEAEAISQTVPEELLEAEDLLKELPSEKELAARSLRIAENRATVRELEERMAELENHIHIDQLELAEKREALLSYFRAFAPMDVLNSTWINELQSSLMAKAVEQKTKQNAAREERDVLKDAISRADQRLELSGEVEQRILETSERMLALKEEQEQDAIERAAISLALETISQLTQEIHDSFGKDLNGEMSRLSQELTAGAYAKVTADEKLEVKAGKKTHLVTADKLSAGTTEQLQLALRMAVGRLMYKDEEFPLVFDDSFAFYDEERLKRTLSLLAQEGRQVLVFTCHTREERIAQELGLAHHNVRLEG